MSARYDCIVIGAGHNGLVCATYLARGGRKVLVLEANDVVGGAAVTREFAPGFRVSAGAHILHMLPRTLIDELALTRHGLSLATAPMPSTALSPDGAHISLLSGAGLSGHDAGAYLPFMARLRRMAAHLRPLLDMPPPRLGTDAWSDQSALLRMAWHIRRLGRADMRELLRIIGMNVYDLAEDNFESHVLRGAMAFDAVLGSNAGPRAPGTVLNLLYRLAGETGATVMAQPEGGMGAVSDALAAAARASGVTVRNSARVSRVLVRDDRAAGAVLDNGEVIEASAILSSAGPRTTFMKLLGAEYLDTGFVRRVTHFRDKGLTAKFHLALDKVPTFRGLDENALRGRLILAPSLDYIENAFNPTKYGGASEHPALELTIPSAADASLAPQGKHVLSAIVQYAPYAPKAGWDTLRTQFQGSILETLEAYAPGLRGSIITSELLTPEDIERNFNMDGGHWHHGELAFDQFFMVRPVPGAAQYQAPVAGLYLCGAGAHPGGGIMGAAGRNAARHVLSKAA